MILMYVHVNTEEADGAVAATAAAEEDWGELDAGERNSLLSQRLKVRTFLSV